MSGSQPNIPSLGTKSLLDNFTYFPQCRLLESKIHLQILTIIHNRTNGGVDGSAIVQFDFALSLSLAC